MLKLMIQIASFFLFKIKLALESYIYPLQNFQSTAKTAEA